MGAKKLIWVVVGLAAAAAAPLPARAQSCFAFTQDAAVSCFVNSAVKTKLTSLRYGMTLAQFRTYGIAVSKILQTQQTYVVTLGMAGAVADAMPPTNADGSANVAAQQTAMNAIVAAEVSDGLATIPTEATEQDLQWFSLDVVSAMNESGGMMLSPGALLRVVDSYVITGTSNGSVNWTQVNQSLSSVVSTFASSGAMKLPATVSVSQVQTFAQALAQAIYNYKLATNKTSL